MVKWTQEQEKAIYTGGSDILVAAAAGSGKTAVLVERIIQKLLNKSDPVDIDTLLVVTFTNAAAQEMKSRVGEALEKALTQDPASSHLKKQLALLQSASISTLHSFCLDVVRKYAYLLDIDPGFRIADDMEADLMKQDVLDDLFEEWYSAEGMEQEQFFAVVDRFSGDRSDIDVENVVLDLYTFAMQNPWPEEWLNSLAETYDIPEDAADSDLSWLTIAKQEISSQLTAIEEEINAALRIAQASDGPSQYIEAIEADTQQLMQAKEAESWYDLQAFMTASKFVNLSRKRTECDEEKKKQVQTLRNSYKERWNKMKDKWFSRDLASHVADMREMAPVIRQLTELVKQFKEKFAEHKREKGVVDFSDLEHLCLSLLADESETAAHPVPSTVAKQFQEQFNEVLVDEYQDVNLVQETILTLISDQTGTGNRFMVGDVKQSIYRFRHAEPSLFIEKYKRFAKTQDTGQRIDLARNFRSREHVLTGANYIFRQILDEELGEINYDPDAELIYANKMYDALENEENCPELLMIDRETAEEDEAGSAEEEDYRDLEKAELEARAYATKIKQWIGQKDQEPLQVVDKATSAQRDVQYRDIVILQRSMTWAPTIVDELKKQGIPVYAELSTGYFEAIEVKMMISFLKVIDNPRQDIPLASVLRSPIVGLNEEELARVRLADHKHTFYDALKQYMQQNSDETADKVNDFMDKLKQFRLSSRQGALAELIWDIYRETGFYDFAGGMPGGRQRQANLRALYDRARGYEATSFRGLFRFLRFIERMEERGDDLGAARALSEQEDVVRIMTIHKSKGLEFPAVILGGMDKQFNFQDLRQKYLLHKDLGFASRYIDPVKRITYPTLFYHAISEKMHKELLAEEMRVLYVALTRAKEKLVMVGNVAAFAKKREKWEKMLDHPLWVLPKHYRAEAKTYLDWVGPALIRHRDTRVLRTGEGPDVAVSALQDDPSAWQVSVIHGSTLTNLEEQLEEADQQLKESITNWEAVQTEDEELGSMVRDRLSYTYPFQEAAGSRAKQTVTEIKRQREIKDEYSADQMIQTFQPPIMKRPNFMQKEKTVTAADRGTAMHTVMQHIPMKGVMSEREIAEFIEGLTAKEILTVDEAEMIDTAAIAGFFTTSAAAEMMQAEKIYREVPFSLTLPASDVYARWENDTEEQVLIQGVIDCLIPKDDGWMILDYKTDTIDGDVTDQVREKLISRYQTQMELYRRAVQQIWREPVKETHLYFFAKQLAIEVPE